MRNVSYNHNINLIKKFRASRHCTSSFKISEHTYSYPHAHSFFFWYTMYCNPVYNKNIPFRCHFSYKIYILSLLLLGPCNDLIRSMEGKVLNENQITPGCTLVSMLLPEEIGFAP